MNGTFTGYVVFRMIFLVASQIFVSIVSLPGVWLFDNWSIAMYVNGITFAIWLLVSLLQYREWKDGNVSVIGWNSTTQEG